ncbi:thioesterase domain-containing protein [Streptomyces sp. bgisy159]|uniref:thioesterase domain-containing protein n=1 Tax=Streptomyces sp. bgisy159 TaxID=3413795 RepID=UPI003F49FFD2
MNDAAWFPGRRRVTDPRVRMFCLPHGGAGASAYRGWQEALGPEVEVVPVHLPGRESRVAEPPEGDMRRLAARLAEPLARRAAGLPYAVFGHSMGAWLGYEVTRLLEAAGRPPAVLIASGAPAPSLPVVRDQPLHLLSDEALMAHLGALAGTPSSVLTSQDLLELVVPALRADFRACETYVHGDEAPLSVPLVVLGGDADAGTPVDSLGPWRDLTRLPATISVLPGGHFFHHDDTNREAVMAIVSDALQRAASARPAPAAVTPEEAVRTYYSLVDAKDFTGLVELFTPTAVYRRPGYEPLVGREALAAFYRGERVIVDGRHSVTTLVAEGNRVAVNGTFNGTVKDGREVGLRFADFFTLDDDGRFTERDTFFFTPMV